MFENDIRPKSVFKVRKYSNVLDKQFSGYAAETSIHGIKYLNEKGRHWSERLLWLFLCIGSAISGCYLCYPIAMKWINFPTITTILQTNFPVSEIPFPAVTICPNNKVFKEKLLEVIHDKGGPLKGVIEKFGLEEDEFSRTLSDVLGRYLFYISEKDIELDILRNMDEFYLLQNISSDISSVLKSVMLPCNELLVACQWQGVMKNCEKIFTLAKSDSGYCCSFNLIETDGQFLNDELDENSEPLMLQSSISPNINKRLLTSKTANSLLGLSILLNGNRREYVKWPVDNHASNNYFGFKVLVHSPQDFPEVSGRGLALGVGQEAFIAVTGEYIQSSESVKKMDYRQRKCLYYGEMASEIPALFRPKAFKDYTMVNCLLECNAAIVMDECGCLPYHYPDFEKVWDTKTSCNVSGLQCLADNYLDLKSKVMDSNSCSCPEDCDKTSFFPEMSQGKTDPGKVLTWLTTRPFKSTDEIISEFAWMVYHLEQNDWNGVYEDGEAIVWDGLNLETCTRDDPNERDQENEAGYCSHHKRQELIAQDLSLMHVYFKETHIRKYLKEQNFGWVDAIASVGGIVGLCMGFSLLSLAEFVYFFTIRLFMDRIRRIK